jgi:hypothetical protein
MNGLLRSEEDAVEELKRRLASLGRAPTLVLAGPIEARLDAVLRALAGALDGSYLDLAAPEVLERLKNSSPLHGRDIAGRLSDTVLRQFLLGEASAKASRVLAVHVPEVMWKIMAENSLREWASPCPLVLSYPLGADPSSLTVDDLSRLLAHHLVELKLTEAERRYREGDS